MSRIVNVQGWEIDKDALPKWSDEKHGTYPHYQMFESPGEQVACLIYSILEVRMCDYRGFCAVYQDKHAPELILPIRFMNFYPQVDFSADGNLIFLKACYRVKRFLLILNVAQKAYAIVHFSPPDMGYRIQEKDEGIFMLVFDEKHLSQDDRLSHFHNTAVDSTRLRWRKWTDLANGEDLNLQERGVRFFFKSKEKIWQETKEQLGFGAMSGQEFVDINRDKVLYYFSPYSLDEYGHVKYEIMKNERYVGEFLPVFSTREACVDYMRLRGIDKEIFKARMKNVMKYLDAHYPSKNWGIIIDPDHPDWIAIPSDTRVTPKSLRY